MPSIGVDDKDDNDEDNRPLVWAIQRRMVILSIKGKEKVAPTIKKGPSPLPTRSSLRKLLSNVM